MSKWLYSIIGVIFLSIFLELVYPKGRTNSFCKAIFGVMAVVVIISPLLKFKLADISNESIIDTNITTSLQNSRDNANTNIIIESLKNVGIYNVSVEINSIMQNNKYEIENILIDVSDVVLNSNIEHTYMYKVILDSIENVIHIENNKVIIYG